MNFGFVAKGPSHLASFAVSNLCRRYSTVPASIEPKLKALSHDAEQCISQLKHEDWVELPTELVTKSKHVLQQHSSLLGGLGPVEKKAAEESAYGSKFAALKATLDTAQKVELLTFSTVAVREKLTGLVDSRGSPIKVTVPEDLSKSVDGLFLSYEELIARVDPPLRQKVEDQFGYQLTLIRRMMHIPNFGKEFPDLPIHG
mmetsp:Transcript_3327/g.5869  ORF Transcript_3327/g.5869 Transcript_3327/m.5869 type:complete len:201 (+) Transcript_3327:39-641(+)|eukprot:CAMPEP_0196651620 /NCGR_PEP_ID=MMETSP1086-20130531/663_1 /TAXON_ID=77921 /ORGANISM="Cyanoptyche  gloeocystis , Strain SAG4.97" /LENGTH=200 /DNA_ID=CAMNT_0041981721 /DNA_START=39 /DNA_END=641 /DNA_ORIENTATION=+